jgi:hypothetical protein
MLNGFHQWQNDNSVSHYFLSHAIVGFTADL